MSLSDDAPPPSGLVYRAAQLPIVDHAISVHVTLAGGSRILRTYSDWPGPTTMRFCSLATPQWDPQTASTIATIQATPAPTVSGAMRFATAAWAKVRACQLLAWRQDAPILHCLRDSDTLLAHSSRPACWTSHARCADIMGQEGRWSACWAGERSRAPCVCALKARCDREYTRRLERSDIWISTPTDNALLCWTGRHPPLETGNRDHHLIGWNHMHLGATRGMSHSAIRSIKCDDATE